MNTLELLSTGLIAAIPGATIAIIGFLLSRKGANRKLKVEEDGQTLSEFDTLSGAALKLYETEKQRATDAETKLAENTTVMQDVTGQYRELAGMMYDLRDLFQQVVREAGIQLTTDQQAKFDATRPKSLRHPATQK